MIIMTRSAAKFWWKKELPKHIKYLYKYFSHEDWKEYGYAECNAERKKKQEEYISRKRYFISSVPCFIQVYNIDNDWFFGGFYIDIVSLHNRWHLNWRTDMRHEGFFPRIKQHLPLGLLPIDDDNAWFREFCKTYPMKPKGIQKPRGKYLIHCIIDSFNNLIDIDLGNKQYGGDK